MLRKIFLGVLIFAATSACAEMNPLKNDNLTKFEREYVFENVLFIRQEIENLKKPKNKKAFRDLELLFQNELIAHKETFVYLGEYELMEVPKENSSVQVKLSYSNYITSLSSKDVQVLAQVNK